MKTPEQYRIKNGSLGTTKEVGNNGAFRIPFESYTLDVIASDGMGWEHVSVSMPTKTPNWKQMCFIKDLFWNDDECVVQYHPPRNDYINNHEHCLHLWKEKGKDFKLPPSILIGIK